MDMIEGFYAEATKMIDEVKMKKVGREKRWEETAKSAALLPDL